MNEIERTQQRTRGYWYSDGITELVGGVALALVGLPMIVASRTGIDALSTIALIGMIVLFPLSARAIRYLKDRITHQRTGYVKYPRPSMSTQRKALLVILFAVVGIVIIISFWRGESVLEGTFGKAFLLGSGGAMSVAFAVRAVRMRLPRFFASAAAAAAATLVTLLTGIEFNEGLGLLLALLGVTSIITGAYALSVYLGRHPKAPAETP